MSKKVGRTSTLCVSRGGRMSIVAAVTRWIPVSQLSDMIRQISGHQANAFTKQDLAQLSQLAVKDPVVTSVRFEGNVSEGKMYCVFEAPDKKSFETWLSKHNVPYDYVVQTSIACEGGTSIREL